MTPSIPTSARNRIARWFAQALLVLLYALGIPLGAAAQPLPSDSVYQAEVRLTDQDGRPIRLDQHRGQLVLASMFYTSCPYACPVTIETLRDTLRSLPPDAARSIAVLLMSTWPHRPGFPCRDPGGRGEALNES